MQLIQPFNCIAFDLYSVLFFMFLGLVALIKHVMCNVCQESEHSICTEPMKLCLKSAISKTSATCHKAGVTVCIYRVAAVCNIQVD